jgi:microcompartment protein CcmK/EutM
MFLAKVVGNIVSTVKVEVHENRKLMLVQYLDGQGRPYGPRRVAFDCGCAGVGDTVLVNVEGGSAKLLLDDDAIVANMTICGVVDSIAYTEN